MVKGALLRTRRLKLPPTALRIVAGAEHLQRRDVIILLFTDFSGISDGHI